MPGFFLTEEAGLFCVCVYGVGASPLHTVASPRTITLNRAFKVENKFTAPNLIGLMGGMGLMLG